MTIKIHYSEEAKSLIIETECKKCGEKHKYVRNIYDLGREPYKPVPGDIDYDYSAAASEGVK